MAAGKKIRIDPDPDAKLEAFLGRKRGDDGKLIPKKTRARRRTVAAASFGRTMVETQTMIDDDDWSGFAARHIVALYSLMHKKCYGVEPAMTSTERHQAVLASGAFVKRAFEGDYSAAVEYFQWLWDDEIGVELWAKTRGIVRKKRMGFYLSIHTSKLTDYRVDLARSGPGQAQARRS